jgi:hypothetical protein
MPGPPAGFANAAEVDPAKVIAPACGTKAMQAAISATQRPRAPYVRSALEELVAQKYLRIREENSSLRLFLFFIGCLFLVTFWFLSLK